MVEPIWPWGEPELPPRRPKPLRPRKERSERRHVEQPVVDFARSRGVLVRKLNGLGYRDWPDDVFFMPGGRPLLVEFKAKGELPTPKQKLMHRQLRKAGYTVRVIDDKETGCRLIDFLCPVRGRGRRP